MTQAIRLMIADDHAIMREGLKQIFLLDDGIKVVGEAADGGRCWNGCAKAAWICCCWISLCPASAVRI